MGDGPRPVVKRRRLRTELRGARQEAGLTQDQVAEEMDWSPSKIIRIEAGSVGVSTNDMRALLRLYHITDHDRVEELLALARVARERSTSYKDAPPKLLQFIEYEAAASVIRGCQPLAVPGLLQTEDYARAVVQQAVGKASKAQVEAAVAVRMKRQEVLDRPDPPQLFFVLDESVLRRQVGGEAVMRRQIRHLLELASRPDVTIEVVPFSAGAHPGMQGPFVILEFPDAEDDDVLYLESSRGDLIVRDEPEEIASHRARFEVLRRQSLGRKASKDFLDSMAADTASRVAAI
jgi:transcriptional regulator with XRE-family HTH domain